MGPVALGRMDPSGARPRTRARGLLSMTGNAGPPPRLSGWVEAARLVALWLDTRPRIDRLMEEARPELAPVERARCQHLVFGVVRHAGRLEAALGRLIAHPPRFSTRSVLFVAGFELIEAGGPSAEPGHAAKIVHHAVERAKTIASPAEARFVNAALRKLWLGLSAEREPPRLAPADALADYFSHPAWLVRRWLALHGAEPTRALLEWNQRPAAVHARWRGAEPAPAWLEPTPWPGYFEVPSGRWADVEALLKDRSVYLQDPSARLPVALLNPRPGEAVIDLCAAPGGKSLLIADAISGGDAVLATVDLPGPSLSRLRENLAAARVKAVVVAGDIRREPARLLREAGLPAEYAGVLIDVPCSNTGVMRHRVDVKWRLQEGDFGRHARQQAALLASAARLVAPSGRLVYSTCSIDPEENEGVVAAFVAGSKGGFAIEAREICHPWTAGHDGGGAFLLRRR